MTTSTTASAKAPLKPPVSTPKNPIPGPAEIAAKDESGKRLAKPKYSPPNSVSAQPRAQHGHPLLRNLTNRGNEVREISPAIAEEILGYWNRHNRPFLKDRCRRYEEDMLHDRFFADNGETISFDFFGDLIDGQNRLAAIVRTGLTFRMLVCSGLDPKVRPTVDSGASRTLGQSLAMQGVPHAEPVGRAARLLVVYERRELSLGYQDIPPQAQPTLMTVNDYIGEHSEELAQAVTMALDKPFKNQFVKSAGVSTFMITLFRRQDPELARLFMYQFATGCKSPTDKSGLNAGHAILLLRDLMFKNTGPKSLCMTYLVAFILKAWIAVRDKKAIKLLTVRRDENFPNLDEGWPPAKD